MTVQRLATAALLHDIGKFWSRTSQAPPYTEQERDHFGTYAHALWTGHFIERHLGDPELAAWARMHHAPDSRESLLISLADWLSSSERHEDDLQERDLPENAALQSIVSTLSPSDTPSDASSGWYLPLSPHGEFRGGFFPEQGVKAGKADYDRLWASFMNELAVVDATKAPLTTWMALMRKQLTEFMGIRSEGEMERCGSILNQIQQSWKTCSIPCTKGQWSMIVPGRWPSSA